MRAMPTMAQASINPNDFSGGGRGAFQKKQFQTANQHYIHHNAVLPTAGMPLEQQAKIGSPVYKDPYASIAAKPNQISLENSNQLQN